jgi:transcriptional regulator with GAF, ATPase, and Fis domain
MLRVGLIGALADRRRALSQDVAASTVEFSQVSSSEESLLKFDLVLGLRGDGKIDDLLESSSSVVLTNKSIISVWSELPPQHQTDDAIQRSLEDVYGFVVGYSPAMHRACRWIRSVAHQAAAALDLRTLVLGETGTGKELVARAIHRLGLRNAQPFRALNCSAIAEGLLTAELFGHVKGAFTGATQDRTGALAATGEGTLLLDEVGDMPLNLQAPFLRVLEERSFSPVGSTREILFKGQVISATNQNLAALVESRAFRSDLYFRLAQVCIPLPPLRDRISDIPVLVRHLLRSRGNPPVEIDEVSINAMREYAWPGNIRELRVAIEKYLLFLSMGDRPKPEEWLGGMDSLEAESRPVLSLHGNLADLSSEFEKSVVRTVLARCNGDTLAAARELGVTRRSVYNLVRRHGIELRDFG